MGGHAAFIGELCEFRKSRFSPLYLFTCRLLPARGIAFCLDSDVTAITLLVRDPIRSKHFYEGVFGQKLVHEDANSADFRFENTIINLLSEPGVVVEDDPTARVQFTIQVADVDAVCRELAGQGISLLNGCMNRPWGVRTASFKDPDGHIWGNRGESPLSSCHRPIA